MSSISFIVSLAIFIIFLIEAYILLSSRKYRKHIADFQYDTTKNNTFIYVIIPCLNEELVIQNTLNALLLNKTENIQFIVIDDGSTDHTSHVVEQFEDSRLRLLKRTLPDAKKGKGEALNFALRTHVLPEVKRHHKKAHDVIVAVMDADSYVDADYFRHVNILFASNDDIQAIQSKVKIVPNTNSLFDLTHMQDLEFSVILNFMQGLRAKNANAALGGNGQFTRLSALETVMSDGPWTHSLVEDFDLSTRLTLANIRKIVHIVDLVVFQSGVPNFRKLLKQRTRWAQGNMHCNKFIPQIVTSRHISFKGKFELTYFLTKPWLVIFEFFIIFIVAVQILVYGVPNNSFLPAWVSFVMIMALFVVNFFWSIYYLVDKEIQTLQKSKPSTAFITLVNGLFLSFFMIVLNLSYFRAFIRLLRKQNDWDKTERDIQ